MLQTSMMHSSAAAAAAAETWLTLLYTTGEQYQGERHGLSHGGATNHSLSRQPSTAHRLPQRTSLGVVVTATVA